ncbi:MAG: squalene synthase HpnD [Alphaproteobacteria bacterium]|nr:squalene synthase HpnD [Alphaproteobacteria bacterium]
MTAAQAISADAAAHASETVKRSGTSFAAGMAILPRPRREGMHAIYAFCREVDDIADDDGLERAERLERLKAWRAEVERIYDGAPETATGRALVSPVRDFDLPKAEFLMMIDGMEMDANGPIVAPSLDALFAYTRRVAGSVGLLSMPTFGAPKGRDADRFALALGDALQLTNILRDIGEDAAIGRLYLPRELLEKHRAPTSPGDIVGAPGLANVAEELGQMATGKFGEARMALRELDWRIVRPALLMMGAYETYLLRLRRRGWDQVGTPLSLSKVEKSLIAMRWYVAPRLDAPAA